MILKTFELKKLNSIKSNIFLLYGENEGYKNQIIQDYFINNFKGSIERFEENEILNKYENFISGLLNKSFFEDKKLIIISRASDKIIKLTEEILNKNLSEIKLIINTGNLEKKSKLRNFFEKEKNIICIPIYSDDVKTLSNITNTFFKKNNISISQEGINIMVDRSSGDRQNLKNEIEKVLIFTKGKNIINIEDIVKLTNLAENYSISELVDNCLSKNLYKTIKILNENNYSSEDCILIVRTLLSKCKRIFQVKKDCEKNDSIDKAIASYKPTIFWKDKDVVKKQVLNWSFGDAENLIYKINDIELLIKKNYENSVKILSDFILNTAKQANN